ncbi:MAG: Ig-like domain-containing protein [Bacteroidales bacterium]|nr:Ig-like domain-containing protein [Bacteroidales bacterium]
MIYTKLINILAIITISYLLVSCANPVSPSGGPQDVDPPLLIKAEPPLFTKKFTSDKIKIIFNEFIQLKDVTNQVIISPPMDEMPDFKAKGKSLIIELNEELKENTTYNIFLGDAIVDLTENNPASNFQYVFSTGNMIDSLSIKGNVLKAFDLTPVENVNVMLYLDINDTIEFDSLPYYVKPYYLTKTNEQGDFLLNNLADNQYKLFVLLDLNGNMIYDQPSEEIAFIDSLIIPQFDPSISQDTTLLNDTITEVIEANELPKLVPIDLSLFQEIDSVQRVLKVVLAKNHQLNILFKLPVTDLQIRPLNLTEGIDWAIIESNKTSDTLIYWLKNVEQDSLTLEISDAGEILDTTEVAVIKRARGRKEKKEEEKPQKLTVKYNIKSQSIDLNEPLILTFDYPIESFDLGSISLFENDTIPLIPEVAFIDSNLQRKLEIKYKWKQGTPYSMLIPDSVFFDIHGHSHDTLGSIFISKTLEDYGNLYVSINLLNPGQNHIVQLLSGDNVIIETTLTEDQRISYEYLNPGNYRLKVVYDQNNNGIWDTGDYFYKTQPEIVDFFPGEITVRANWDIEEEWEL